MRDWLVLQRPMAVAAAMVVGGLVHWGLVSLERADLLVPPPEQTAEHFLKAVKAHNFGAARHTLKRDLQAHVTERDLAALARELERRRPPLDDAQGVAAAVRANSASATVEARMQDGQREALDFSLVKENGLWKLSSIEPARALAAGGPGPRPQPALHLQRE